MSVDMKDLEYGLLFWIFMPLISAIVISMIVFKMDYFITEFLIIACYPIAVLLPPFNAFWVSGFVVIAILWWQDRKETEA